MMEIMLTAGKDRHPTQKANPMRTCTITQAKASAVVIRKCIEQAEQIRNQRKSIYLMRRCDCGYPARGSEAWQQRYDRLTAIIDELSAAFEAILSRANSLIADMATMVITDEPEAEVILEVAEHNAEILATAESATVDSLEAEKHGVSA